MKFYKLRYRLKSYLSVVISNDELRKLGSKRFLTGDTRGDNWPEIHAELFNRQLNNNEGGIPNISDWVGNMVFSKTAYNNLKIKLADCGEFLPITIGDNTWYIFNVTAINDQVDETSSEQDIMDGMIMGVHALAFKPEAPHKMVFRSNYDRRMSTYCTDEFKQLIEDNGYSAILFREDLTAPM